MNLLLVEWDAESAAVRAEELREAGHDVVIESHDAARVTALARQDGLDAVVVSLAARPTHSWQTARPLVARLGARLILIDGDATTLARAAATAPQATIATADTLLDVLETLTAPS